jgi:putative SOS response-associated peptidase YedK
MEANALMSEIHNIKKRMPIIVSPNAEQQWLKRGELYIANDLLQAKLV